MIHIYWNSRLSNSDSLPLYEPADSSSTPRMVAITYNLSDKTNSNGGTDTAAKIPLQAIALDLPLNVSRALIRDIRAGKGALVEFGRQPVWMVKMRVGAAQEVEHACWQFSLFDMQELRCGKQTFSLKAAPSRFPGEIYRRKAKGSNDYDLVGSVHHDLSLVEVEKNSAAMDAAVAQLKNSLASYQQEKEANKYVQTYKILPKNSRQLIFAMLRCWPLLLFYSEPLSFRPLQMFLPFMANDHPQARKSSSQCRRKEFVRRRSRYNA